MKSANTNKAGIVYPSRTKKARHAAYIARKDATRETAIACRPAIDLLPAARANGVRRHVRGLTALLARAEPIERSGALVARGQTITIEPHGRTLTADEAARLLDFATTYFAGEGAT